jgi:hypothetical protein
VLRQNMHTSGCSSNVSSAKTARQRILTERFVE